MTQRNVKNVAASVHRRLLNAAKQSGRPFNELLQHYAIERFLYRLANSAYADRFFLKGALTLFAIRSPHTRPTRDIDLLGRINNDLDSVRTAIAGICEQKVVDIWAVLEHFKFDGQRLSSAIERTFSQRQTALTREPVCFMTEFAEDPVKNIQWNAFVRTALLSDVPHFSQIVSRVREFLQPIAAALAEGRPFAATWTPHGPWRMLEW